MNKPGRRAPLASVRTPLSDREIDELSALLDALPAPLEPLDVSSLDGFLCGVLVQPEPVARERWLVYVTDGEGRGLPTGYDAVRLRALIVRREAELQRAIAGRTWFDPWVFNLSIAADAKADASATEAVFPWVAGFAAALETFPSLLRRGGAALNEPLALLYRHLDPGDLEDADELLAEIDASEPPADLSEAVQGLVRATFLLADAAAAVAGRDRR